MHVKTWMPGTRPGMTTRKATAFFQSSNGLADRFGDRPARQHADQMGAIFGAAVDVAVHAVGRNAHAFERFRREAFLKRLLERGHAEHAIGPGTGHRDADVATTFRYEHTDQRETRRLIAEFLIGRFFRNRKAYFRDDFRRLERRRKHPSEKVVGLDAPLVGDDGRAES